MLELNVWDSEGVEDFALKSFAMLLIFILTLGTTLGLIRDSRFSLFPIDEPS